ncbi:MAG TPA: glycine oxidase ThiO [Thermoleophilaceae bacterium]
MADALRGRTYDVVVVGAGIVGLASAWRAAQRGLSVLVVDRGLAGTGASGVAAGMLAPVTEAEFGEEALLRLNLEGAAAWPGFAAELAERTGVDTGYRECGALVVAVDRDDLEEVRRLHAFQRSLGLDAEWLGGRDCRALEPGLSPRVGGGVLAPHDHQVDPRSTIGALRTAFEAAGGELLEGVAVTGIEESGGAVTGVRTSDGPVAAGRVVLAAGAWTAELASGAEAGFDAPPVRPVKGQILRLGEPPGATHPLAGRIVRTPRCYVVPRPTGEVVVGATVEERGFDRSVTAGGVHRLLEAAWEALPDVEERELVETAASFRPGTPDNAPVVGPGSLDGLIWATGHHRNGILLAPLTAAAVCALLAGDSPQPAFDAFGPERFQPAPRAPAVGGRT